MGSNVDINVVAENIVELLTNSTNMATVFYDIFLNPIPMDITLYQYNDENELEEVVIPNRAKDRKIALDGVGTPEGNVTANVGTCYIDTSTSLVYFKVTGSGNTGWVEVLTMDALEDILANVQQTIATSGTNVVLLNRQGVITSSADISDIGANKSLSNLNATGNAILSNKASIDLDNLSATGEARFEQIHAALQAKASVNMDNITDIGAANIIEIVGDRGANKDLSNLTDKGNAKFQYPPFSINNGTVSSDGDNETLQVAGLTPFDRYIVPELSANDSEYGTCSDYRLTQGTLYDPRGSSSQTTWTMQLDPSNYIPADSVVTFTLGSNYIWINPTENPVYGTGCWGCKITYTYVDNTSEIVYDVHGPNTPYYHSPADGYITFEVEIPTAPSNIVKAIEVYFYPTQYHVDQTITYNLTKIYNLTFRAQGYEAGTAGTSLSVTADVIPALGANVSTYGTASNYLFTVNNNTTISNWTMQLDPSNYIPANTQLSFHFESAQSRVVKSESPHQDNPYCNRYGDKGLKITLTYTDNTSEVIYDNNELFPGLGNSPFPPYSESRLDTADVDIPTPTSGIVKTVTVDTYVCDPYWGGGYDTCYRSGGAFTLQAAYTISSGDTLICTPCTITTADSRTKSFEYSTLVNCSTLLDGTYKVLKSYVDGSLIVKNNLDVQGTTPVTMNDGNLWLNNAVTPLALRRFNGSTSVWVLDNDYSYLGDVVVTSGVITDVRNRPFNACPAYRYIVKTYQDGTEWYEIYSDGWIRQGGFLATTSTSAISYTLTFIKKFRNTDYIFDRSPLWTASAGSLYSPQDNGCSAKTVRSVTFSMNSSTYQTGTYWVAEGYGEI